MREEYKQEVKNTLQKLVEDANNYVKNPPKGIVIGGFGGDATIIVDGLRNRALNEGYDENVANEFEKVKENLNKVIEKKDEQYVKELKKSVNELLERL